MINDVPKWLVADFEAGYVPMDEPPGLEEAAYKLWKEAGGEVTHPVSSEVVTALGVLAEFGKPLEEARGECQKEDVEPEWYE